ncbi:I78 family peptidase inhibitor [Parasphingorhabdus sp.]|uniref:I78 family peptidase inhibitor n=1 Tax=Parasphingorhabdus sp. TaxID=2709688 RepID=UPI002F93D816
MKVRFLLTAITCPALMACSTMGTGTPPTDNGMAAEHKCKADGLETFVGQKATAEIGATAIERSGARNLRWIPPNTAVTMDYREDRLNIEYDDKMVITRVHCG